VNQGPASAGGVLQTRDPLTIRLHYRCDAPVDRPVFGVAIHRDDGVHVTGPNTRTSAFPIDRLEGTGAIDYAIDHLSLLPGRYLVSAAVYDEDLITAFDHRDRLVPLVVVEGGTAERFGVIELVAGWRRADASAREAS
jgi:lipopolysaccharide transport system ATP-binding protein